MMMTTLVMMVTNSRKDENIVRKISSEIEVITPKSGYIVYFYYTAHCLHCVHCTLHYLSGTLNAYIYYCTVNAPW